MTDMPRESKNDYLKSVIADTVKTFSAHQIVESSAHDNLGRWMLMKLYPNGRSMTSMWAEIIEGRGGYLYVNGDISACVFGICSGQSEPGRTVQWMSRSTPDDYMAEKLRIGMTGLYPSTDWHSEFAGADLDEYLAEYLAEERTAYLSSPQQRRRVEELAAIRRELSGGDMDQREMCRRLYEAGVDPESFSRWGECPSIRMITAWGALRRLAELLRAQDEAAKTVSEDPSDHPGRYVKP